MGVGGMMLGLQTWAFHLSQVTLPSFPSSLFRFGLGEAEFNVPLLKWKGIWSESSTSGRHLIFWVGTQL
jgi:hypothetical protein